MRPVTRATWRPPTLDKLIIALNALEEDLDDIHRPASTDQSGEDYAYIDKQWAEIGRKSKEGDSALDAIVSAFNAACKQFGDVIDLEMSRLRDMLKVTDDNLLNGNLSGG